MNPVDRTPFAHLPTPVESMPRLSAALGGPRLLVKRDDQTGLALGGNKTRKLEFLVAEAQRRGADTLLTAGAVQSNHCRQTAAAAARFGLRCTLVLSGEPPPRPNGNLLLDQLFGAELVYTERNQRNATLERATAEAAVQGRTPYLIPIGGSNPTGALGYVFAMEELAAQGVQPDWIVFPSSSGGTQAGMVLGARRFGCRARVLGISVDEPQRELQEIVATIASGASKLLGPRIEFAPAQIEVNADYCAAGYGVLTDAEREAVRLFARTEGLLLDPVYTGRAAGGLIDLVRQGFFRGEDTVLFWHTGGAPALFAEAYAGSLD